MQPLMSSPLPGGSRWSGGGLTPANGSCTVPGAGGALPCASAAAVIAVSATCSVGLLFCWCLLCLLRVLVCVPKKGNKPQQKREKKSASRARTKKVQ
jgi:cyanate permease